MRPEVRTRCLFVLHRMVMHVVEMTVKVIFIANGVFPEPALPDAAGLLANAGIGAALFRATGREVGAREPGFEEPQADGEVGIPARNKIRGRHSFLIEWWPLFQLLKSRTTIQTPARLRRAINAITPVPSKPSMAGSGTTEIWPRISPPGKAEVWMLKYI